MPIIILYIYISSTVGRSILFAVRFEIELPTKYRVTKISPLKYRETDISQGNNFAYELSHRKNTSPEYNRAAI